MLLSLLHRSSNWISIRNDKLELSFYRLECAIQFLGSLKEFWSCFPPYFASEFYSAGVILPPPLFYMWRLYMTTLSNLRFEVFPLLY